MAFDLDNEELKATRKLHNQDDGLYEETSDKNVENIETTNNKNKYTYIKEVAEKIVNEYREKYKGEKFCPEPSEQTCMAYEILHLLAEREQDKKRIQELEAENKKLKEVRVEYDYGYELIHFCTKNDLVRIDKNKYLIEIKDGKFIDIKQLYIDSLDSIPKQKVKEILDDIYDYFERLNGPDEDIEYIENKRKELLEE